MPLIQVKPTIHPCQVDDFDAGVKRSVVGSLHIKPSSTLVLTADELAHIQNKHSDIASHFIILALQDAKPKSDMTKKVVEKAPEKVVEKVASSAPKVYTKALEEKKKFKDTSK
jgi:hypothetical protein